MSGVLCLKIGVMKSSRVLVVYGLQNTYSIFLYKTQYLGYKLPEIQKLNIRMKFSKLIFNNVMLCICLAQGVAQLEGVALLE